MAGWQPIPDAFLLLSDYEAPAIFSHRLYSHLDFIVTRLDLVFGPRRTAGFSRRPLSSPDAEKDHEMPFSSLIRRQMKTSWIPLGTTRSPFLDKVGTALVQGRRGSFCCYPHWTSSGGPVASAGFCPEQFVFRIVHFLNHKLVNGKIFY